MEKSRNASYIAKSGYFIKSSLNFFSSICFLRVGQCVSGYSGACSRRNRGVHGVPTRCWCGEGIATFVSKTDKNPFRRFYRCKIAMQVRVTRLPSSYVVGLSYLQCTSEFDFFCCREKGKIISSSGLMKL